MKKTQKTIAILIVICLGSLIVIQTLYSKKEYHAQKIEFVKDVNRSLEIAITKAEERKADSILKLFERDALDTSIVKFKFLEDSIEGLRIAVIDPKTGGISITLSLGEEKEVSKKDLLDAVLKMGREYIQEGIKNKSSKKNIIIWDDPLMNLIQNYKDSMPLNQEALRIDFDKELRNRNIESEYFLLTTSLDSNTHTTKEGALYSRPMEWKTHSEENAYIAEFNNPFFTILSRSALLIGSSVLVILMLIFSFILLMRILNRQKKLSAMKDDFMDNISHEMLTPISTLSVALESIKNFEIQKDKAKFEKYLNIAHLELERMSDLFHNVLLSSSFENRKIDLNFSETELIGLLENLKHYHIERSEKRVEIEVQGPKSLLIKTDKEHLTNCINNLLDNAIKYCQQPIIKVKVKVSELDDTIQIEIEDNGAGIKESDQNKIFNKFYRANSGNEKGLGIGLYYVKTILIEMNATISLKKSSKEGSTFLIELNK
tara:strand:- start:48691 stop:50154 length:1464 start_codon:yes stop_codon:yes gene_type:complete